MRAKTRIRLLLLGLVGLSALVVGFGYATGAQLSFDDWEGSDGSNGSSGGLASGQENVTVVATDSNTWRGLGVSGPRSRSELVAFDDDGEVLYYDDTHTRYWDVDPVPGTAATVEFVYSDHVEGPACDSTNASRHAVDPEVWDRYERARPRGDEACTRNGIDRVNLTTGEVTPVWSRITPGKDASRYHDADRINETHWAVADIYLDRVFVVNASADRIVWSWNASDAFPTSSGGPYPSDWTHINDVEVLPDGRYMVSVRNHDQVVFVEPGTGVQEEWTLGSDDDHDVLYEQHNPDFVPAERGGPAVIVSDSENNRVQEFQRTDDGWERTWEWSDARMQWARDADRLPNGHTLVTDSNGDRVFEVDGSGDVVWSVNVGFPYEAERLGTGDESSGGPSTTHPETRSNASAGSATSEVKRNVGGKYLNAAMYVTPVWMGTTELVALLVGVLAAVTLAAVEAGRLVRSRL